VAAKVCVAPLAIEGPRVRVVRQAIRGSEGARGPAGPAATRAQVLEAVQAEFDEVRKELRVQLDRMAQIQRQVDSIERLLVKAITEAQGATAHSE
jgi:hypothetical protein